MIGEKELSTALRDALAILAEFPGALDERFAPFGLEAQAVVAVIQERLGTYCALATAEPKAAYTWGFMEGLLTARKLPAGCRA